MTRLHDRPATNVVVRFSNLRYRFVLLFLSLFSALAIYGLFDSLNRTRSLSWFWLVGLFFGLLALFFLLRRYGLGARILFEYDDHGFSHPGYPPADVPAPRGDAPPPAAPTVVPWTLVSGLMRQLDGAIILRLAEEIAPEHRRRLENQGYAAEWLDCCLSSEKILLPLWLAPRSAKAVFPDIQSRRHSRFAELPPDMRPDWYDPPRTPPR